MPHETIRISQDVLDHLNNGQPFENAWEGVATAVEYAFTFLSEG